MLRSDIHQRNTGAHARVDRNHRLGDDIAEITRIAEDCGDLSRLFLHLLARRRLGQDGKARDERVGNVSFFGDVCEAHAKVSLMNFSASSIWPSKRCVERTICRKAFGSPGPSP